MLKRPPIVVIMGSVDHGKTTLLDYIRKTSIAATEVGGITQSIGAYEIIHVPHESRTNAEQTQTGAEKIPRKSAPSPHESALSEGKKITFIDTPGHEAFSKMRERGTKAADIAVIVVAADDSVKPQTREAIKIVTETQTPFIVAINKIDKNNADVNRTKNDLMQAGVLLEGYGGNVSYQPISAKTGEGIHDLLDLILLTAEVEDLKYDPSSEAQGFILESKLDSRKGIIVSVIVTDGILRVGDNIAAGSTSGKIKILEDFLGKSVKEAAPSLPVLILGFSDLPKAGDRFRAGPKKVISDSVAAGFKKEERSKIIDTEMLSVILKADVSGSLEALSEVIRNISAKHRKVEIIEESVGEISDGDVKMAIATKAVVVGFRAKITKAADNLARANNIRIIRSEIIYELTKTLEEFLVSEAKPAGKLEILAAFGRKGGNQIIGGKVLEGEVKNNSILEIERKKEIVGNGRVINLQQGRKDTPRVEMGNECGLLFDSKNEVKIGDILVSHL